MNNPAKRQAALKRMKTLLENVAPRFESVLVGEPLAITNERSVFFWFDGEEPPAVGERTMGNAMVCHRFMVRAFYQLPATAEDAEALELQIWNDSRAVQEAFAGDSTLGKTVTDLTIRLQSVGFEAFNETSQFRSMTWVVCLDELEAEEIAE